MAVRLIVELLVYAFFLEAARRIAVATSSMAHPNPIVRSHRSPVPYLGGTGLILAFAGLSALRWAADATEPGAGQVLLVASAVAVTGVGTWDDLRALAPARKVVLEAAACLPFAVWGAQGSVVRLVLWMAILLVLVNAFNLVDVMDGLLCILALTATLGLLLMPAVAVGGARASAALLLPGLVVAFAFNRPPAALYLGDAGALALGLLVGGWLLMASRHGGIAPTISLTALVLVPLLETALLVAARLARSQSPLRGSPDHFSLRLQHRLSWDRWRVLAAAGGVAGLFALVPTASLRLPQPLFLAYAVACLCLAIVLWVACWRLAPLDAAPRDIH